MTATKFFVGRFSFVCRDRAVDRVKAILHAQPSGVLELVGDDREFAEAVLAMHPQREDKLLNGCCGFVVKTAEGYTTRSFAVVTDQGGYDEFSYKVAFGLAKAKPSLASAARNAVAEDVFAFKKRSFEQGPVHCAVTGVPLSMENAHVDHAPPYTFNEILREFTLAHPGLPLVHEGTKDVFFFLDDRERFRCFHHERAELRIVLDKVNLSRR